MTEPQTPIQAGGAALRDPKLLLRSLTEDQDGRLPIMQGALAAAMMDPINRRASDRIDEALSHFDGLIRDVVSGLAGGPPSAAAALVALNEAIQTRAGYGGAAQDYDDLSNANLFRVIERRRGLPVALGILYMHVGRGAGLEVDGLAFPGHFLIQVQCGAERVIADPFLGGMTRDAAGLRALLKTSHGAEAELTPDLYAKADDRSILLRLQNNMKLRLLQTDQQDKAAEVLEIMLMIDPNNAGLWREAGVLNASLGNLRAAITALHNYIAIEPRDQQRAQAEALIADLTKRMN
ncbi:MAG: transglutaminase-like domain-containing protein [Alphaproteobacteria bacterium]|nr:transglutaminase-like domain-containing protein [Alphaproteobacteria bacterium]